MVQNWGPCGKSGAAPLSTLFELWHVTYVNKSPITNERFIANFESAPIKVKAPVVDHVSVVDHFSEKREK